MSKKTTICIVAGLVAPLLWTPLESILFVALPLPTSRSMFRGFQVLVGLASAIVLVLPLAFAVRPSSPRFGLLFIVSFLFSVVAGRIAFGGTARDLLLLFQLPDTWIFLLASLGFFWFASRGEAARNAA